MTALVPEEDVWQFEVMKTCARMITVSGTENKNPVSNVDLEDPSVSKTITVFEARMGEKLDSKEMRKRKAKEVQELDRVRCQNASCCNVGDSNDTRKEGKVKMGGNTKGSKRALVRVVWSQPSRRQYSKDQVYQEMWMVEWLF